MSILYASGALFLALELLSLLGIAWSRTSTLLATVVLAAGAFFLPRPDLPRIRLSPFDALLAAYATAYTLFTIAGAPWHWDFWAIWGFKARTFFEHGGIDWRMLSSPWTSYAHPDYPLLVPLNLAVPAIFAGEWNDRWLGVLTAAYAIGAALVARRLAARALSPSIASLIALATLALCASRYIGLAEAPLIAFSTSGLLLLREALRGDDKAWVPAALMLGFAASTKNEGVSLLFAVFLAMVLTGRVRSLLRLWPAIAVIAPWLTALVTIGLRGDMTASGGMARTISRLNEIAAIGQKLLERVDKPLLWLALLLVLPFVWRRERFLLIVVGVQLAVFLIAWLTTPRDVIWHIETSWNRLSRQLLAPATFAALSALAARLTPPAASSAH